MYTWTHEKMRRRIFLILKYSQALKNKKKLLSPVLMCTKTKNEKRLFCIFSSPNKPYVHQKRKKGHFFRFCVFAKMKKIKKNHFFHFVKNTKNEKRKTLIKFCLPTTYQIICTKYFVNYAVK